MVMMAIPTLRSRTAAAAMLGARRDRPDQASSARGRGPYLGVLAAFIAMIAVFTSYRLGFVGHIAARIFAVTVAGLLILGQVLNLVVGLPGADELAGSAGVWDVVGLTLAVLTVVVLAADRDRSPALPPPRPPYAL